MLPTSLETIKHSTPGEKRLFALMRRSLSDSYTVRYEMIVGQRDFKPDFMVFEPKRGVLILEVKDWELGSFAQISPETFMICGYGGSKIAKPILNPEVKCQEYLRHVREQLRAMPELRNGISLHVYTNSCYRFSQSLGSTLRPTQAWVSDGTV